MTTALPQQLRYLGVGLCASISAEAYHADTCPEPSLSAGTANSLVTA